MNRHDDHADVSDREFWFELLAVVIWIVVIIALTAVSL